MGRRPTESARLWQSGIAIGEFPKFAADARHASNTEDPLYRAVRNAAKLVEANPPGFAGGDKRLFAQSVSAPATGKSSQRRRKRRKEPRTKHAKAYVTITANRLLCARLFLREQPADRLIPMDALDRLPQQRAQPKAP